MNPYVSDSDFSLYVGDVFDVLHELPDASVDCCVTSPPYWGLRDYGDAGQIGLEPTPEEFVANIVRVFVEVRRVLSDHGSVWLNLGDSYVSDPGKGGSGPGAKQGAHVDYGRSRIAQVRDNKAVHGEVLRPFAVEGLRPKNLVGIPWRVAFALQADGWFLRADVVWNKPNPMPESVTDRPTKSHEYVFMLTKRPHYFFDQEAVREPWATTHAPGSKIANTSHYGADNGGNSGLSPHLADVKARLRERDRPQVETLDGSEGEAPRGADGRRKTVHDHRVDESHENYANMGGPQERWPNGGRNIRSVWTIPTQPFQGAHFAVFPEELVRRCVLAGCPERVCSTCGKPQERIVESESSWAERAEGGATRGNVAFDGNIGAGTQRGVHAVGVTHDLDAKRRETIGLTDCGHDTWRPGVVLDPFGGSGTTALVARKHGRRSVLIELNPSYAELAAGRLNQLSLFAS